MERGTGRLRSIRSHAEITLGLIREMKDEYTKYVQANRELKERDFADFLTVFEKEFDVLEKAAEEIRVLEVRLEEELKSVGVNIARYRKKIKKHPQAGPLLQHINNLLIKIKKIRRAIREEAYRSVREEGTIARNI